MEFIEAAVVTRCDTCCSREWNLGGSFRDIFYAWPFFVQCASCQIPAVCLNINYSLHNSEHHKNSNGAPQFVILPMEWESERHRNYGNGFYSALLFSTLSHLNKTRGELLNQSIAEAKQYLRDGHKIFEKYEENVKWNLVYFEREKKNIFVFYQLRFNAQIFKNDKFCDIDKGSIFWWKWTATAVVKWLNFIHYSRKFLRHTKRFTLRVEQ